MHEVAQVPESLKYRSCLKLDSETVLASSVAAQSQESSSGLRVEKLESTMLRLVIALEVFQEKHSQKLGMMESVVKKPQLTSTADERSFDV